jgi:Transposase DNA-binding
MGREVGMDTRSESFGMRNFGSVDLKDQRRTRRLVRLTDLMCRHPGGTLPDKLNRPADLRAFYRLMNCAEVTHQVLIASHADETRARIAALPAGATVLILHDATELDFTSKRSLRGQLGKIGQGTNWGYITHNSMAVLADTGETLGLTSQILHHRAEVPDGETTRQSRERQDRESRLWVRGAQASGPAAAGVRCVDVSDSLSDTFEYLFFEVTHHRHFVLRSREERCLATPLQGEEHLYTALRKLPAQGQREVAVLASPSRKARTATMKLAFSPVRLAPPGRQMGEYDKVPLALWAIRVWEPRSPAGEEPLEWILLTNVPVATVADAEERLGWYEKRPIIEEFHKGMKTGCGIETMQFEKIERLEPAIAVLSAVTTTLLRLRDAARAEDGDRRHAVEVIDPAYVDVLARHYGERLSSKPTIRNFFMHVARLGGHQNRKGDGFPGWLTLWRGWMKLESMLDGYRAARAGPTKCGKT